MPKFNASGWMSQAGYESGKRAEVLDKQVREESRPTPLYVIAVLIVMALALYALYAMGQDFVASIATTVGKP